MIKKIARRAGGFASTTAMRWLATARDADVVPTPQSHAPRGKPVVAGAVALAAAALSTKKVRTTAESALRGFAGALRTEDGGNGYAGNVDGKTRAELYELAKKAGVSGRSGMSKEELARALSR
ncbi:MAG TPA: Rho termination factor N-terminal domain-containing protein [Actinomycetota bacterium]|nr:Rho termination factor N-terminal domain-containing protein [Actinomycetota bacterium]